MTINAGYSAPLQFTVRRDDSVNIVSLSGAASMYVAENLRSKLLSLIDDAAPNMIIDLSGLTYISSIGIGALLAAHVRSQTVRGAARLVNPTGEVARILDLTSIDTIVEIHATIDDAVGSLPSVAP